MRKYNAFSNLYWNDPPYEIVFLPEGYMPNIKGLTLDEEGFSLTNWEGGGGYSRIEGEMLDTGGDSWMENEESNAYRDEGNG